MNAISCPRCDEQVRVPASLLESPASPDLMLRCPWCSEEFPSSDVQDRLPPMLEFVSPPELEAADGFAGFADIDSDGTSESMTPESMVFDGADFTPTVSDSPLL